MYLCFCRGTTDCAFNHSERGVCVYVSVCAGRLSLSPCGVCVCVCVCGATDCIESQ